MSGIAALQSLLRRIDRRSYRAYKDLEGAYDLGDCVLFVDHVQGDPFAAPSKLRLRVPMSRAALPRELFSDPVGRVALSDYLARAVRRAIHGLSGTVRGSGKSGELRVDAGGQEVLPRTAVVIDPAWVEVRLHAGLPAQGRTVLGREAEALLLEAIPSLASAGLVFDALPAEHVHSFVHCVRNQAHIRGQLSERGLVAFVADGSILPRASGASDRPLGTGAVPWRSPESLAVEFELQHALPDGRTRLRGTGIPQGVTLIVGGGYHGKSTLLQALQRGVYAHVPGDGREYVVTDPRAVKIRAEDGRSVQSVDISPFISNLPQGRSTRAFCSPDASGSTSQAANIMEALEVGAGCLLLDEDTSATNFMVRDARMQALVHHDFEPITPFVDRVKALSESMGISSVLVMGGSGDYFEPADTVLLMRDFEASQVTAQAKTIAEAQPTGRKYEPRTPLQPPTARVPIARSLDASRGRRAVRIDARGVDQITFGEESVDLRAVEQLVDPSQTRAAGHAIELAKAFMGQGRCLSEVLDLLQARLDAEGLDLLDPYHRPGRHPGDYALPRRFELAAALNRVRSLRCAPTED